jgi:hydroxymethylpyrimidine pyrophosphatase-like HAD family hydrolase
MCVCVCVYAQQGFISQVTFEKAAALRQQGAAFVIVSGARTATVLQRMPFLPAADAIVAENGAQAAPHAVLGWGRAVGTAARQQYAECK